LHTLKQLELSKRILYIQYTNPAGYPPLEHSSRILAGRGWQVLFLGTDALGSHALRFPSHPSICVRQISFQPAGWRQKLHYLRYCVWVLGWALHFRPQWIYASDPLACPAALLLSCLPSVRVLYHEHDSPSNEISVRGFQRLVLDARRRLARRAEICVLPNEQRGEQFVRDTGVKRAYVRCVWNCPAIDEITPPRSSNGTRELQLLYHGSIVPARLPPTVICALTYVPEHVRLSVVGYETIGHQGYVRHLREQAESLGVGRRVDFIGTVPTRRDLLQLCRKADVGLAFMPKDSQNINEQTMLSGASNKTFDYLASGTAVLVTDIPDWRAMYVDLGYGLACNSDDPVNIAEALRWFLDHPTETRALGERGRQRVLDMWNYERQFEPVLEQLNERLS
jgi:glycosyltransferase involved in cell wall biosynthesis